jgi:glycosyltransferase involved in cell wall biosynthesis
VPFGDLDAIASAIGRLLHDRDQARRLGAAGRAKVMRDLTWDRIYAQVRAVYDELV